MNNLSDIEQLAHRLISKHGLSMWGFEFDKSVKRLGQCRYYKRTIGLSESYAEDGVLLEIENTILHEIAHALVGSKNGHNSKWKEKAIEIGCNGKTKSCISHTVRYKYIAICHSCGNTTRRHKVNSYREFSCGVCSKGKYKKEYKLTFVKQY